MPVEPAMIQGVSVRRMSVWTASNAADVISALRCDPLGCFCPQWQPFTECKILTGLCGLQTLSKQCTYSSPPPPPLTLSLSLCDDSVLLQEWITINRDYGTNMLTERFLLTYQSLQRSYVYHVFFGRVWPWRNQRGHLHYAPMLGSGGCGLLCLHLRSRPCMYQKFCIIFVLNTSFVSCTSRPQLCIPDDRWHTVERELHSSLLWIRAEHCWHLLQDGQVLTQYSVPSLSSAWKVLLV